MAKAKKKAVRGGAREGAGRKPKFNEKTETIAFRLPGSLIENIRNADNANERAYMALKKEFDGVQQQQRTDGKDG